MIALLIICIVSLINSTYSQEATYYRSTPIHGSNYLDSSNNNFTCPGTGAITTIKYYIDKYITQLEFVCSSPEGIRSFGPYGAPTGTQGEFKCPVGQYISSLYGNSEDRLNRVGVRCRNITDDLKGPGTVLGTKIGGTDSAIGPEFDDLPYSNGARPIGATIIYTSPVTGLSNPPAITGIVINYANIPVELCTANCTQYQEELAPLHGVRRGIQIVCTCPDQGVITGIKTFTQSGRVRDILVTCTSGFGRTTFGTTTFGTNRYSGDETNQDCLPGTIIGSIHGKSNDLLYALGVRCVTYGETGPVPKYDARGGTGGTAFDDSTYSERGWRPVQVSIYFDYNVGIYGIQVKYANLAVGTDCKVSNIEVLDNTLRAVYDGFEVIGAVTGTCCSEGYQLLKLAYLRTLSEVVTIETTDGTSNNFLTTFTVSGNSGVNILGPGGSVEVSASYSFGGSTEFSTSNSNSTATSSDINAGTDIKYDTPGACLIIGYVDRYKFVKKNIPVRYDYFCASGNLSSRRGTINLQSTIYGNAYFDDYQYKYTNQAQCTSNSRDCVKRLDANDIFTNSTTFVAEFYDCFPAGSGAEI